MEHAYSTITADEEAEIRRQTRVEYNRKKMIEDIRKDERSRLLSEQMNEAELRARLREDELKARQHEEDERTADRNFVKVYPAGWSRIRDLIPKNKSAAIIYTFLAENIDDNAGAVTVSQELMSDVLGLSRTTIWRALNYLIDLGAVVKIPVAGSVNAYALNAEEVWKSKLARKRYAAYTTKTLAKTDGTVTRKMKIMYREQTGKEPPASEADDLIED